MDFLRVKPKREFKSENGTEELLKRFGKDVMEHFPEIYLDLHEFSCYTCLPGSITLIQRDVHPS